MTISFTVTKVTEELVAPSGGGGAAQPNLPLSSIDHAMGLRFFVEVVAAYEGGGLLQSPADAIRAALARGLAHYYPVAGRLVVSEDGELEVACTGEGVWFVEAKASRYSLSDLRNLEFPLAIPKEELLPCPPPSLNQHEMIFMLQVTELKCGGFAVGVKFHHMVFDGVGAGHFLKAIADVARGLPGPAVEPVWFREAIPAPPIRHPKPPPTVAYNFVRSLRDFPPHAINAIKDSYARETSHRCTTFDALSAVLWRSRVRAIGLAPEADAHFVFPADARHLVNAAAPGYYGNCVYCSTVSKKSELVARAPVAEIVGWIREAKANLAAKFAAWAAGDFEDDPFRVPIGYDTLNLSDWRRVGFHEVDYGSGAPRFVAPLNHHVFFAGGILLKRPAPEQGVRFVGQVVTKEHEQDFVQELKEFV
ncbi:acyl transferase 4-like [Curcuma longa]|uniref:acyl transferase 4-like n=1 Tax=Curcuma longa TaxID=136217 RepID=UPI003D9FA7F4